MVNFKRLMEVFESGFYLCGKDGKVYTMRNRSGNLRKFPKLRKPTINEGGYARYSLRDSSNRTFHYYGHRLVWVFFNGEIPKNLVVNHKDCNKLNNSLSNLELVTPSQNRKHAKDNDRYLKGEKVFGSRLKKKQVIEIMKSKETQAYLASLYGVDRTTISAIKRRKNWSHL